MNRKSVYIGTAHDGNSAVSVGSPRCIVPRVSNPTGGGPSLEAPPLIDADLAYVILQGRR